MPQNEMFVATKALLLRDRHALLVCRSHTQSSAGIWEFPGGRLEFGETPAEGILREIREETGLDAALNRLLYAANFMPVPSCHIVVLTYLAEAGSGDVVLSDEHTEYVWADRKTLLDLLQADIAQDMLANIDLDGLDLA